jgi:hypothetical protein
VIFINREQLEGKNLTAPAAIAIYIPGHRASHDREDADQSLRLLFLADLTGEISKVFLIKFHIWR